MLLEGRGAADTPIRVASLLQSTSPSELPGYVPHLVRCPLTTEAR
jgi:hypothetical protein